MCSFRSAGAAASASAVASSGAAASGVAPPEAPALAPPAVPPAEAPPPPVPQPVGQPYVHGPSGKILSLSGKPLDRVYCNPFKQDLSVHVACFHGGHQRCSKWQRVCLIPNEDTKRCAQWIARASEFKNASEHIAAWDDIVLGTG